MARDGVPALESEIEATSLAVHFRLRRVATQSSSCPRSRSRWASAKALSMDSALSSKVLRIANSRCMRSAAKREFAAGSGRARLNATLTLALSFSLVKSLRTASERHRLSRYGGAPGGRHGRSRAGHACASRWRRRSSGGLLQTWACWRSTRRCRPVSRRRVPTARSRCACGARAQALQADHARWAAGSCRTGICSGCTARSSTVITWTCTRPPIRCRSSSAASAVGPVRPVSANPAERPFAETALSADAAWRWTK